MNGDSKGALGSDTGGGKGVSTARAHLTPVASFGVPVGHALKTCVCLSLPYGTAGRVIKHEGVPLF